MNKILAGLLTCFLMIACLSCGSGAGDPPAGAFPLIAGSWEFIASSSSNPGFQTGLEVNLQEGRVLANSFQYKPNGQLSASGLQQIQIVGAELDPANNITSVTFTGACGAAGGGVLSGTVDTGFNVALTYSQGNDVFTVKALLSSDFKSMVGTYTLESGGSCEDSGLFTATQVPKLAGVYTGQLILPDGTTDDVSATLSESSPSKFSANLIITGTQNTSLSLSGVVMGNSFSAQGTFQSQSVTYYGYSYQIVIEDGINQGITQSSLYLVNATDPNNLVPAGTLTIPIPPL